MPDGQGFVDYYQLLGISTNAGAETIRRTFISKAKQYHPDIGGSTELMQQYTRAYRTLMSQSSRRAYDLVHAFQTGTSELHYREHGDINSGGAVEVLSDNEIDDFLDKVYAEYHYQPNVKKSLFEKLKNAF